MEAGYENSRALVLRPPHELLLVARGGRRPHATPVTPVRPSLSNDTMHSVLSHARQGVPAICLPPRRGRRHGTIKARALPAPRWRCESVFEEVAPTTERPLCRPPAPPHSPTEV